MARPELTLDDCRFEIESRLFTPSAISYNLITNTSPGLIGVEIEAFPFMPGEPGGKNVSPVSLYGGEHALTNRLLEASLDKGGKGSTGYQVQARSNDTPRIDRIEFPDGDRILFEPGGQVEIATAPCASIAELKEHLVSKQDVLRAVTQAHRIHFSQTGANPWFDAHEIVNQLDRPRYRTMQAYFDAIGPYGRKMMLLTCGMHINLDLGRSVDTRMRRIVAANLLVPFATGLFAHSPRIAGKSTGRQSYRSHIWQQTDASRTGILPMHRIIRSMRQEDLIDTYLDFALKAPLIALDDHVLPGSFTFAHWMNHPINGIRPTLTAFQQHLTLLFPEVRLRGYLELRTVDSPPVEWQLVPAMFYAGLLYSDDQLDRALDLLMPLADQVNTLWDAATYGLTRDEVYSPAIRLMELSIEGLSALPDFCQASAAEHLIAFYETFTRQRKCFADS